MSTQPDDDLARAWQDLMNRYHRIVCLLDRALQREHGISSTEFAVLEQLAHAPQEHQALLMHELGDQVHISQSALSRMVSRLEAAGLVQRAMCSTDRRSVYTSLTPAGQELYETARPTQREILRAEAESCSAQLVSEPALAS